MNIVSESKDIKTQEIKLQKYIEKFITNLKNRNAKIKSMMSNTDYIEWLIQFSKDKDSFSDDDWLYFPERISKTDRENVQNLSLFYEGIAKYSQENYIYPTLCEFGNYYNVKFNNFNFQIGGLNGQGTTFFFNKIEENEEFIDFNDIITLKKQDNVDQINSILDNLSNMILSAYETGVPIQAIINKIDNTIDNINSKIEDKPKLLIKK